MADDVGARGSDDHELEQLALRLFQAIRAGEKYPIRLIDDDAEALLVRCFANSMLAVHRFATELERLCVEHHINKKHWNLDGIKKRGATQAKLTREQQRAAEAAMKRSGKTRTDNQQSAQRRVEQPIGGPDMMMLDDDPMMRIVGLLMFFRAKRLWWDDFHKTVRLDWKGGTVGDKVAVYSLDDMTVLRIMIWAKTQDSELARTGKQIFIDAIELVADLDHRNEVKEYLEKLTWDGTRRIDTFMVDIYHAAPTEFNCAVGANVLVALVARIYEPGCQFDNMMVMIGSQGVFKSQSLRALGGQWYRSLQAGIDTDNFVRGMHGAWVIELPELSSMTKSAHNAETTKARMSTQVDSLRPLYKNFYRDMPRNSVTFGTTNEEHFHHDPSSDDARRYWPVFVCPNGELIELELLKADRDQLFAEALVRYRAGHKYWEVPGAEQRALIERVRKVNEFQDTTALWLANQQDSGRVFDGVTRTFGDAQASIELTCWNGGDGADDWGTAVTIDRVAKQALGLSSAQLTQTKNAHAIGEALRHLGFSKKRCRVAGDRDTYLVVWRRTWVHDDGIMLVRAPRLERDGSF